MDRERGSLCPTGSQPRAGVPLVGRTAPIAGGPTFRSRTGTYITFRRAVSVCAALACLLGAAWDGTAGAAGAAGAGGAGGGGGAGGAAGAPGAAGAAGTAVGASPDVPVAHPGSAPPVAQAAASSAPSLLLIGQTAFVAPGQSFDVRVRLGAGNPPATRLGLAVTVYACLSSVSAFDQSVTSSSGPSGTRISQTHAALPLSGLPVSDGTYALSMPVGVGSTPPAPAGGFSINLTAAGAQCGAYPSGVYPVRLELVDTGSGQQLGGLTTHLVYVGPTAGTQKLRVAVVLPIQTTLRAAPAPSPAALRDRPSAALSPPAPAAVGAVIQTVGVLAAPAHSSVPLTLEAAPQTVGLLGSTGHQATVTQLASLGAPAGAHEIAASPFVPVDAANLVAAALQPELGLQVAQGVQLLDTAGTHPAAAAAAERGPSAAQRPLGTWFSDSSLDTATLTLLQQFGYGRFVLPAATVPAAPTNGSTAEPFALTTARGSSVPTITFNADLSSRFAAAASDPVLAAHQLVAELAQIYYERPNGTTPRGVAAVAPNDWTDSPAFVDAMLGALDGSQILQPVTTANLFGTLGPPSVCHGCRLATTTGQGGLPAEAIRAERRRINGLFSSAPGARALTVQLSEVLLAGQTENLRPTQQAAVVANTGAAVDAQLAQLAVTGDRTITLTSQHGQVPVTIVSAAPYAVSASMTLTSDKLLFANHSTSITVPVTLAPGKTTVVYVNVQSRASGLFKVAIVLRSPVGGMLLSTGQVSVRSTASSIVGIVLSVGAIIVLLAWWIRTSRRRRRARRPELEVEAPREPVATG